MSDDIEPGRVRIRVGLQVANNLATEFEAVGLPADVAADILQALTQLTHGLEANLQPGVQPGQPAPEQVSPERKSLIIPQVVPKKPIREPGA